MMVTNDEVLAEILRVLRVHGGKPKYHHRIVGGNFRLDALQAAILRVKLKYLTLWTESRRNNDRLVQGALQEARSWTSKHYATRLREWVEADARP